MAVCAVLDRISRSRDLSHVSKDELESIDFHQDCRKKKKKKVKDSEVMSILITSLDSTVLLKKVRNNRTTKEVMLK